MKHEKGEIKKLKGMEKEDMKVIKSLKKGKRK